MVSRPGGVFYLKKCSRRTCSVLAAVFLGRLMLHGDIGYQTLPAIGGSHVSTLIASCRTWHCCWSNAVRYVLAKVQPPGVLGW